MTALATEVIPADMTDEQPARIIGRQSYDMIVNSLSGMTLREAVISRIPASVTDKVLNYSAVIRLVIQVEQTG